MRPQYQHFCHYHATKGSNPAHWHKFMSHGFFVCSKQIINHTLHRLLESSQNQLSHWSTERYVLKKKQEKNSHKIILCFQEKQHVVFYCYYLELDTVFPLNVCITHTSCCAWWTNANISTSWLLCWMNC